MNKFNIYTMRGATEEDNETLLEYLDKDMEDCLFVDRCGRVYDGSDRYIADYIDVEPGEGIGC